MGKTNFSGKKVEKKGEKGEKNKFRPNLSLGACLAMCLFFEETEPSVLINCVLTKKNKCMRFFGRIFLVASTSVTHKIHRITYSIKAGSQFFVILSFECA